MRTSILPPRLLVLLAIGLLASRSFAAEYSVTTTADGGAGSLREAITLANTNPGSDRISFGIAGSDVVIQPGSELPSLTGPVTIDGILSSGARVQLDGSLLAGNEIGLRIEGGGSVLKGLVIRGFPSHGISLSGGSNTVTNCYLGTNSTGMVDMGNGGNGIVVWSDDNTIGGTGALDRNLISGNDQSGVSIAGGNPEIERNVVLGNFIGTDATGAGALGNSEAGVVLLNAIDNTVGGDTAAHRNVISGNGEHGVWLLGTTFISFEEFTSTVNGFSFTTIDISANFYVTTENHVRGNYIGVDVSGANDLGNGLDGVRIEGGWMNYIGAPPPPPKAVGGGVGAPPGNVISGNDRHGVCITSIESGFNTVRNNLIGTAADGVSALANGVDGVRIEDSPLNQIGGSAGGDGNVVSANGADGVGITGSEARVNAVQGNLIGLAKDGASPLGNTGHGVHLDADAPDNVIGGAIAQNVITGANVGPGGNAIAHNGGAGVSFDGTRNSITLNDIRSNGGDGVQGEAGSGNAILRNSIDDNGGLGIDLLDADGVTPNDDGDPDEGANHLQNFPELTLVTDSGATGQVDVPAGSVVWIEFFTVPAADASGHGEGRTYIGAGRVEGGAGGTIPFQIDFDQAPPQGHLVSATATAADLSTSEFSWSMGVGAPSGFADVRIEDPPPEIDVSSLPPCGKLTLLFSTDPDFEQKPIAKLKVPAGRTQFTPAAKTWVKKVLKVGVSGATIHVRAVCKKTGFQQDLGAFKLLPPTDPTPVSPAEAANLTGAVVDFEADFGSGAKCYLEFSRDAGFGIVLKKVKLKGTTAAVKWASIVKKLDKAGAGGAGYFRIRGTDALKRACVSAVRSFTY